MVVKTLLIVYVTTLNFSIVPRCSRPENMMTDMIPLAKYIKRMNAFCFGDVSKFASTVGLDFQRYVLRFPINLY